MRIKYSRFREQGRGSRDRQLGVFGDCTHLCSVEIISECFDPRLGRHVDGTERIIDQRDDPTCSLAEVGEEGVRVGDDAGGQEDGRGR